VLDYMGQRQLANSVVEVEYYGGEIRCRQYPLPSEELARVSHDAVALARFWFARK